MIALTESQTGKRFFIGQPCHHFCSRHVGLSKAQYSVALSPPDHRVIDWIESKIIHVLVSKLKIKSVHFKKTVKQSSFHSKV